MMPRSLLWFVSIFVLLVCMGSAFSLTTPNKQFKILNTTDNSLTIEVSFDQWNRQEISSGRARYSRFEFKGAHFTGLVGEPQIPFLISLVGIPLDAVVNYTVLDTEQEIVLNTKIPPFPTVIKKDDDTIFQYAFSDSRKPEAEGLVRIESIGFYRGQRVAQVCVSGLQADLADAKITKYHKIVFRLDFSAGRTPSRIIAPQDRFEEFYRSFILNYEQSRKWRKVRVVKPGKGSRPKLHTVETFYRFTLNEDGIFRIDGDLLQSNNIDLTSIDPATIKIFNNGGRELPRDLNILRPSGLVENAIQVVDGNDGRFDPNDFILFYGRGLEGWDYVSVTQDYDHYINHYGFENIYWLSFETPGNGKRMNVQSSAPTGTPVEQYQGLEFIEEELFNPLRSGLNFWGRKFSADSDGNSQEYTLQLPNVVSGSVAELRVRFMALNTGRHTFSTSVNGVRIDTRSFTGLPLEQGFLQIRSPFQSPISVTNPIAGDNTISFLYSHSSNTGQAFLDWLEVHYPASLNAIDDELLFRVLPASGVITYSIGNFSGTEPMLFDITDYANVHQLTNGNFSSGSFSFSDFQEPANPKRYLALTQDKIKSIQSLERVEFNDLRQIASGTDFVIITHDDFFSEATKLESLRENLSPINRLVTEVVRIDDIFNSFSAGLPDPTAIRDFLKHTFDNWSPQPTYVLLLGDGDYDYKNIISRDDKNWIPTFQTNFLPTTRVRELASRTSDSWFTYVSGNDSFMDLVIGRITAQTSEDATNAIDKIVAYETESDFGVWRKTITIIGDDELNSGGRPLPQDVVHITQAEGLASSHVPESFDVKKIYLSEFPAMISASVGGITKPAAREALINQINEGSLIVNYIGHGNSTQWAHEIVFHQSDNERLQNKNRLTFFVAATCDWALSDNPQKQSQAEELLLARDKGAIAIISSARLVFSHQNAAFNQDYYDGLLPESGFGETTRIGDAFVLARLVSVPSRIGNDEKYHVYGDPTLRLAMPRHESVITSMQPDSIVALSTVEVSGEIQRDQQLWGDFNGTVLLTASDSRKFVRNLTETNSIQTYFLPGNSIYRGTVPVINGQFSAKFVVPKDISYGGQQARISTYFWNEDADGSGFRNNIVVSSSSSDLADIQGPDIKISFQGFENFTTGDIINEAAVLVVDLADSVSGINIAGEIGHRITLTMDPHEETCLSQLNRFNGVSNIDLTDLFRFNEGEHLRGKIEFPLNFPSEVEIGGQTIVCQSIGGDDRHTIVVKAWDNSNNSSTALVEVMVAHEEGLVLENVLNYPNPLTDQTSFTFITNQDAEIEIRIYTVSGQLIRTLEYPFAMRGFNRVDWDGRDADGDIPANGVYLYKVIAKGLNSEEGFTRLEKMGRLAIIR